MSRFNYEELATLHTIAKILTQSGELREQLEKIMTEMSKRLGMERGMISILDQKTGETWLEVARGVDIEGLDISYKPGEGITGKVAQTGRPMAIANLGKENLFLDRTGARKYLDRSQLSFLCVPIVYSGKVAGVLSADKLTHKVTDLEEEVAILSAVADLIAKAVYGLGLEEENRSLRKMLSRTRTISTDIIGNSKPMLDVLNMISQVADSGTTVLINGQTGTGKELVARAIHANSPRKEGPFVQVNCAAIPEDLIESELFGHEKGAFTDAKERQMGKFALAHGGVLFLDEIGDLSPRAQAKMLRVLEQGEVEALGAARPVAVDVKVVAATNQDLEALIAEGRFRRDLFYRLNALPVRIPPLREHPEDIPALVEHFTAFFCWENALPPRRWEPPALEALKHRPWPGNIRELKNFVERLLIFAPGGTITPADLPPEMTRPPLPDAAGAAGRGAGLQEFLGEAERAFLLFHLRLNGGNIKRTAEALGLPRSHLYRSLQKLQIPKEEYRED